MHLPSYGRLVFMKRSPSTCRIRPSSTSQESNVYSGAKVTNTCTTYVHLFSSSRRIAQYSGPRLNPTERKLQLRSIGRPSFLEKNKGRVILTFKPFHRATFLDALVKFVDPAYTHFNKRCISISSSDANPDTQIIHFTDGTTAEADVVLVANGIKSSVRELLISEATIDRKTSGSKGTIKDAETKGVAYSNTACYRGLVRKDQAEALGVDTSMWQYPMNLIGKNKVRANLRYTT